MILTNILIIISLIILIYDGIEDVIFRKLFYINYKKINLLIIVYPIFLVLLLISFPLIPETFKIILNLILVLIFWHNSKSHLILGLEKQLFSLLLLTNFLLIINNFYGSLFLSFCTLLTSLSAGIAKLQDRMWSKDLDGFYRFLTMPWRSRTKVLNISELLIRRSNLFKLFCKTISFLTPYFQIFSTILIFLGTLLSISGSKFLGQTFLFSGIAFHLIFPILLFIIAGLGFIPIMYFLNSVIYIISFQKISFFDNISFTFISFLALSFLIIFILGFSGINRRFFPKISNQFGIFIPKGLHVMYTEHNLEGMITFYIIPENIKNNHPIFINPFFENGYRSYKQNFISDKFFCLFYSFMDLILINYDCNGNLISKGNLKYGTLKRKEEIEHLLKYFNIGKIIFNQFNWNNKTFSYKSTRIGHLNFSKSVRNLELLNKIPNSFRLSLIHRLDKESYI